LIHTKRNIFPVVDEHGKLMGIIYSGRLFEMLLGETNEVDKTIADLVQKPVDTVQMGANMEVVMNKMNREDIWILPVVDQAGKYLGFVSKSAVCNKYRALLMRQANYLD